jgi:hypothetical protein
VVRGTPREVRLDGGNVGEVTRVGDTVRRRAGPWSRSVDALLLHLERSGFPGAPRALGYDGLGRQVLSFVEGDVDPDPSDLDCARLRDVGALIREFHDLMECFVPPPGAVWNVAIAPDGEDLVCHHDVAPWNLVRGARTLVLIDWDGAGPGTRLWDLAYAAHGFVPLATSGPDEDEQARRLAALVDGYGLDTARRPALVALLERRVCSMYELLRDGHERGVDPWSRLWDEGHGSAWRADARYVREHAGLLLAALGG